MIPTEPIGSIPRPASLIQAIVDSQAGKGSEATLEAEYSEALRDTIARLEQTGSPIITDGEQTKSSFATYPLSGLTNLAPDGVVIPFADPRCPAKEHPSIRRHRGESRATRSEAALHVLFSQNLASHTR
jgi:methionine synthase II (cobalamin-independent)